MDLGNMMKLKNNRSINRNKIYEQELKKINSVIFNIRQQIHKLYSSSNIDNDVEKINIIIDKSLENIKRKDKNIINSFMTLKNELQTVLKDSKLKQSKLKISDSKGKKIGKINSVINNEEIKLNEELEKLNEKKNLGFKKNNSIIIQLRNNLLNIEKQIYSLKNKKISMNTLVIKNNINLQEKNKQRVSNEESSRTSGDASLTTSVSSLTTRVSSEESNRTSGDLSLTSSVISLTTRVSDEESNRTSGDLSLTNSVTSLTTRVSNEESNRTSGDLSLTNRVSSEESNRTSGDLSLTNRVSSEESNRTSGDLSLTNRVSNEESNRASADLSLTNSISTLDGEVVKTSGDQTITGHKTFERITTEYLDVSVNYTFASAGYFNTVNVTQGSKFVGAAEFENNVTIDGSLTVLGTQTFLSTEDLQVKDHQIILNKDADGNIGTGTNDGNNSGIKVNIDNTTANGSKIDPEFLYHASSDRWKANKGLTLSKPSTISYNGASVQDIPLTIENCCAVDPTAVLRLRDNDAISDYMGKGIYHKGANRDFKINNTIAGKGIILSCEENIKLSVQPDIISCTVDLDVSGTYKINGVDVIQSLTTRVSSEESSRASGDASLTTRVSSEESSRASGDASLTTSVSSLTTRVSSEESSRESGDLSLTTSVSSLTTRVSSEESSRASGDTSLTTRVSSEESSRESGDLSLTTRVSNEESNRISGVSSLTNSVVLLTTRVSNEESSRASGDLSLTNSVSSLDSEVVKISGNQTIAGAKTFSDALTANGGMSVSSDTTLSRLTINGDNIAAAADKKMIINGTTTENDIHFQNPTADGGAKYWQVGSRHVQGTGTSDPSLNEFYIYQETSESYDFVIKHEYDATSGDLPTIELNGNVKIKSDTLLNIGATGGDLATTNGELGDIRRSGEDLYIWKSDPTPAVDIVYTGAGGDGKKGWVKFA